MADILVDMEVDKVADMAVKTDKMSQNSCKQEKFPKKDENRWTVPKQLEADKNAHK